MTLEQFFRWLAGGTYGESFEEEISAAWESLGALRSSMAGNRKVKWVRLSSWTSSNGDLCGAVVRRQGGKKQLFVSRTFDPVGDAVGYAIAEHCKVCGIRPLWSTEQKQPDRGQLEAMAQAFEQELTRLLRDA